MSDLNFDPQVGDDAAIYWSTNYGRSWHAKIVTVSRLTPTQVVVSDGTRFNRRTLRAIGSESTLCRADAPEVRRALMRERFLADARSVGWTMAEVESSYAAYSASVEAALCILNNLKVALGGLQ